MVLVDTSVWIRFLSGKEPFASNLQRLLERDEVLGHELVQGELLIGDRGGRPKLLSAYVQMHQAVSVSHDEVTGLVKARNLSGRGVSWIDAHLVASALVEGASLWTADRALAKLAAELRIAY